MMYIRISDTGTMVHSADKGFKCEVRFSETCCTVLLRNLNVRQGLTRHRMVHSADKEFKCEGSF